MPKGTALWVAIIAVVVVVVLVLMATNVISFPWAWGR